VKNLIKKYKEPTLMFPILIDLTNILEKQKKKSNTKWKWGWRIHPITATKRWHNGIDLPAPIGTHILSPFYGIVKKVWFDTLNGHALRIEHPNNLEVKETAYAHMHSIPKNIVVGSEIPKGSIIGFIGSTGASTGPHLHFVIRLHKRKLVEGKKRSDTDPLPYLEKAVKF
jgi:murein DD-endopeptidase MepM/ murein hydrolase activator NlpD